MSRSPEDAFLTDYSRKEFLHNFFIFFVPLIIALVIAKEIFNDGDYHFKWLLQTFAIKRKWDLKWGATRFEHNLWMLSVVILMLVMYPILILVLWGIAACVKISYLYGLTLILIGISILLAWYCLMHWRGNNYRITDPVKYGFGICGALIFVYQIIVISTTKYDFRSVSSLFLALNMLPVTQMVFSLALGELAEFEDYDGLAKHIDEKWLKDSDEASANTQGENNKGSTSLPETKTLANASRIERAITITGPPPKKTSEGFVRNNLILFALAIGILAVYGFVTLFLAENYSVGAVGFITGGALLVIDSLLLVGVCDLKFRNPLIVVSVMILSRFLLIIFGDRYYFIGHLLVFLPCAICLGVGSVNHIMPPVSRVQELNQFLSKLGFKQESQERNEMEHGYKAYKEELKKFSIRHKWMSFFVDNAVANSLVAVIVFFAIDITIAAYFVEANVRIHGNGYKQWVLGVMTLCVTIYAILTFATWRHYGNCGYHLEITVLLASVIKNAASAGTGVIILLISGSTLVMAAFIFVPLLIDFFVAFLVEWTQADFVEIQPSEFRSPPHAPMCWALWRLRLPRQDYKLMALGTGFILTPGLFGITVGVTAHNSHEGWVLALVIYTVLLFVLPAVHYTNRLQVCWEMVASLITATILHVMVLVLGLEVISEEDFGGKAATAGLVIYFLGLPCIVLLLVVLNRWNDPYFENQKSAALLVVGVLTYVAIFTAIGLYAKTIGSVLATLGVVLVFSLLLLAVFPAKDLKRVFPKWCREGECACCWTSVVKAEDRDGDGDIEEGGTKRWQAWIFVGVVFIAIGFALGVVLGTDDWFAGISSFVILTLVIMLLFTYRDFQADLDNTFFGKATFMSSKYVFPFYRTTTTGSDGKQLGAGNDGEPSIFLDNERVFLIYAECLIAFLWGIFATYMYKGWIGIFMSSLAITVAYAITFSFRMHSLFALHGAIQTLKNNESEKEFYTTIQMCQKDAYRCHIAADSRIIENQKQTTTFGILFSDVYNTVQRLHSSISKGKKPRFAIEEIRSEGKDLEVGGNTGSDNNDEEKQFLAKRNNLLDHQRHVQGTIYGADRDTFDRAMEEEGILQWKAAWRRKQSLLQKIPAVPSPFAPMPKPAMVAWTKKLGDNSEVKIQFTRGQAVRQAMRYDVREKHLYSLRTRFVAQSIINIISQADGLKKSNSKLVLKMAAERGVKLGKDAYTNLDHLSIEFFALQKALIIYNEQRQNSQAANEEFNQLSEEQKQALTARHKKKRKQQILRLRKKLEGLKRQREEEKEENKRGALAKQIKAIEKRVEMLLQGSRFSRGMTINSNQGLGMEIKRNVYGKFLLLNETEGKGKNTSADVKGISPLTEGASKEWKDNKDPEFGPGSNEGAVQSLFVNPDKVPRRLKKWKTYQWARLGQFISERDDKPVMFKTPFDCSGFKQGRISDCYILAAACVLAQYPERLKKIFQEHEANDKGIYSFKFFEEAQEKLITIDDYIPVNKNGSDPVFARCSKPNEMWIMLLEKAFAKYMTCYEAIEFGSVNNALGMMTNGIATRYNMSNPSVKKKINDGTLWNMLMLYNKSGFLMGAGTPAGSDDISNASQWGIVQGHAYAILDVLELDDYRLIRLRNPWGKFEWTGDWSDHSDTWTRRYKKLVERKRKFVAEDDGAFYMDFTDFSIHFQDIYVCKFFESKAGWVTFRPYFGRWNATNSGGCCSEEILKSPQFLLWVPKKNTQVVINLIQEEVKGQIDEKTGQPKQYAAITIQLYANRGRRVTYKKRGKLYRRDNPRCSKTKEITLQTRLPRYAKKGKLLPWTVLIATLNPNVRRDFTVRVFSDRGDVSIEALPPPESQAN